MFLHTETGRPGAAGGFLARRVCPRFTVSAENVTGDETRVLRTSFEPLDRVMQQVINILTFCLYAPITSIYAHMHQFLSVLQFQLVCHFSTKGVPSNTTGCKTPESSAQSSIL